MPLPNFIKQDPANILINVTTTDNSMTGTYFLQLSGTLNPFIYTVHQFKLIVDVSPNRGPPLFVQPLMSPFKVYLYVKYKLKLPTIKDLDKDDCLSSMVYYSKGQSAPMPDFVNFISRNNELRINPSEIE